MYKTSRKKLSKQKNSFKSRLHNEVQKITQKQTSKQNEVQKITQK